MNVRTGTNKESPNVTGAGETSRSATEKNGDLKKDDHLNWTKNGDGSDQTVQEPSAFSPRTRQ